MIQRKQTLFLFQLIFCGIALLFIPSHKILSNQLSTDVFLIPSKDGSFASTTGHLAAIALNLIGLTLTFVTIFLFKKRELQIKLCYALMLIWITLIAMICFCPFVVATANMAVSINYFSSMIGVFALLAAWFAIKFIKKDIDLIKSADRIR